VQPELLILQPSSIAEAIEKLSRALAGIPESGALVIIQNYIRMALKHLADQCDRLGVGQAPGVPGDVGESVCTIHIDRRRWAG